MIEMRIGQPMKREVDYVKDTMLQIKKRKDWYLPQPRPSNANSTVVKPVILVLYWVL
jgi:hypothetical protein